MKLHKALNRMKEMREAYDHAATEDGKRLTAWRGEVIALRDENARLRGALKEFCDEVELEASIVAYRCGLGAGEWEAFIHLAKHYKQYQQAQAALTPQAGKGGGE